MSVIEGGGGRCCGIGFYQNVRNNQSESEYSNYSDYFDFVYRTIVSAGVEACSTPFLASIQGAAKHCTVAAGMWKSPVRSAVTMYSTVWVPAGRSSM